MASFFLIPRDSNDGKTVCLRPKPDERGAKLSIGITFKQLATYIVIACVGLSTLSALFLTWKHLHRYTRPREQRQNIRIIAMPVFFCVISLLSIIFYTDSIYIRPLMDVYEAFCIAALFLLFLEFICPDEDERPKFFANLENKDKKGNVIPGGSEKWFNHIYFMVFQYPLTKTISAGIEIGTQAADVFCPNSLSPKYAHIWLMLLDIFVIGGAVGGVFRFYGRLKREFDPKFHPLAKLVCFKGIVILLFLQDIIFGFLNSKLFKPSATLTYDDLYFGMPLMLTAIEATFFSFTFHFAFRSRLYHENYRPGEKRMSTWRAIFDAMNLSDIVRATIRAFGLLFNPGSGAVQLGGSRFKSPRRERTVQLDSMGREPLTQQRYGHGYTGSDVDTAYEAPGYPPPASPPTQRYPSGMAPSFKYESAQDLGVGRGRYGYTSVDGRDPSPGPDYTHPLAPRDVV